MRYHAPALLHCWIIVTENSSGEKKDGSKDEYEQAEKLIKFITRDEHDIVCEMVPIKNPNNIGETAQAVSRIYLELAQTGSRLRPEDVIADFTGGTAAMSGGMILATLDEGRKVEYVIRGVTLRRDITGKQVGDERFIISPRTSPRMAQAFARQK